MGKTGFKDLIVWQKAKDLAVKIYRITDEGKLAKDYSLRNQIRKSAVSIASNIAEGDERRTDKEAVRFFFIAKGSIAELRTQIQVAFEVGYLEQKIFKDIDSEYDILAKMIGKLIKSRQ